MGKKSKPEDNHDVFPNEAMLNNNPDLRIVLAYGPLQSKFTTYEEEANGLKARYLLFGRIALAGMFVALILVGYRLTFGVDNPPPEWVTFLSALCALSGVGAQIYLIAAKVKIRWIVNRRGAELIRCEKFRVFGLLSGANDAAAFCTAAKNHYDDFLTKIDHRQSGGRELLRTFKPEPLPQAAAVAAPSPALVKRVAALYKELRPDYQERFFRREVDNAKQQAITPLALSQVTFFAGVGLAVLDVLLSGLEISGDFALDVTTQNALQMASWTLFATSALLYVYLNARAFEANADRYEKYLEDLGAVQREVVTDDISKFVKAVDKMECTAHLELRDFLREADRSSFLL